MPKQHEMLRAVEGGLAAESLVASIICVPAADFVLTSISDDRSLAARFDPAIYRVAPTVTTAA